MRALTLFLSCVAAALGHGDHAHGDHDHGDHADHVHGDHADHVRGDHGDHADRGSRHGHALETYDAGHVRRLGDRQLLVCCRGDLDDDRGAL